MISGKNRKTESKPLEQGVLFAIFKYGQVVFEIVSGLISSEDFCYEMHRKIFNIQRAELDKTGNLISYPAFFNYIVGLPETNDDDKLKYSVVLKEIKDCKIKEEDVISYCKQIKEHSNTRKLTKTLGLTFDELNEGSIEDAVSFLEDRLDELKKDLNPGSNISCMKLKGDIEKRVEYLKDMKNNPEKSGVVWTGFKNFDNFNPPLKPGSFGMFQARTNMGKSMMLMGMALSNHAGVFSKSFHKPEMKGKVQGNKVIVITIEMSDIEYSMRMDSHISGFRHTEEFSLANVVEDEQKIIAWKNKINNFGNPSSDILIYWVPENCTPAVVDKIISENPFKPDLVIVDYIGDMSSGLPGLSNYDWKAQAYLYTRMKQLAGKHKCVIFSAQQTIRGVKKISDETGSASDKASHIADLLIAIEQTDGDKMHNDKDSEGNEVEGRYSLRQYKVRSGKRLITHIIPEYHKMNWVEREVEFAMEAGDTKTKEANSKKKKKSILETDTDNSPIKHEERHGPSKEIPKEGIEYEIKMDDSPIKNISKPTVVVNPKEIDDDILLTALSEL